MPTDPLVAKKLLIEQWKNIKTQIGGNHPQKTRQKIKEEIDQDW